MTTKYTGRTLRRRTLIFNADCPPWEDFDEMMERVKSDVRSKLGREIKHYRFFLVGVFLHAVPEGSVVRFKKLNALRQEVEI